MKHLFFLLLLTMASFSSAAQASIVSVEKTENGWRLLRDGAPYFVKGACVWGYDEYKMFAPLDALAATGANSARTYHEKDAQSTLDRSEKLGLTVTLGFDIVPARSGTDFSDAKTVSALEERLRAYVQKYKGHGALLAWGIGNEVEYQQSDLRQRELTFRALNRLARLAKQLDPNHPTVIVTAGMDAAKAAQINEFCPDVDIIGINSYAPLLTLSANLDKWNFNRPYLVTEWGPNGHWESPLTGWNAPIEPTSEEKAAQIERAYRIGIAGDARRCLGSYVFYWGHKQETTATWFGLFLQSGERVNGQDTLRRLWTGKDSEFPAPRISPIVWRLAAEENTGGAQHGHRFAPGASILVEVKVSSERPVKIEWLLVPETSDRKMGGDPERAPEFTSEGVTDLGEGKARIVVPKVAGPYRVFVFARDDKGSAATANSPFFVEAKTATP